MSELQGFDKLSRQFATITPKLERQLTRKGVTAAVKPLKAALKKNIKSMVSTDARSRGGKPTDKQKGNLFKSVGHRVWTVPGKGIIGGVVGPRWPMGAHGHLVERGHDIVPNKRHGKSGKRQAIGMDGKRRTKPIPILEKAILETRHAVQEAWAEKIKIEISKLSI